MIAILLAPTEARTLETPIGKWVNTANPTCTPRPISDIFINPRTCGPLVLLPDGAMVTIDVVGGAVLQFQPTSSWSERATLQAARMDATVTLLPSGSVLIAGDGSAEVYDPTTNVSTPTGPMQVARRGHQATLLPSGKVLVTGGHSTSPSQPVEAPAELYEPSDGTWTITGTPNHARSMHAAVLLGNGKVLVAGGFGFGAILASAEIYDPATEL